MLCSAGQAAVVFPKGLKRRMVDQRRVEVETAPSLRPPVENHTLRILRPIRYQNFVRFTKIYMCKSTTNISHYYQRLLEM